MVERNRFSAFTSVAIGRNSGGWAWLVRFVRPRPWIAASAFQPGFEEIVDAKPPVPRRQFGVIAAPGAARVGEDENALHVVHEGVRSRRDWRRRRGSRRRAGRPRAPALGRPGAGLADDAARAARHLGDQVRAEPLHDLVERAGDRRERGELLDQAVAAGDGLAALDRLAVAKDRPRGEVALAVGERLVELHREGVREVVENIFARRDVDLDVVPVLGRDLGQPALHERLAGRDDLDDGGVAGLEIALDRAGQRGRLHRGEQMTEEALLGGIRRPTARRPSPGR